MSTIHCPACRGLVTAEEQAQVTAKLAALSVRTVSAALGINPSSIDRVCPSCLAAATGISRTVVAEVKRLRERWTIALQAKDRHGTDAADLAEQEAYDALVDYVEGNGLNYTVHDPRGKASAR